MASRVYYVELLDGKRGVCLDMQDEPPVEVARGLVDMFGRERLAAIRARGDDMCLLALAGGKGSAAQSSSAAYDRGHCP